MALTLRLVKGSALSYAEGDANFTYLLTNMSGSNISITGMTNQELERKHKIRPGTPEWFQLWFSKPYLTGEKKIGDDKWLR
jgi:hypothetical protein